MCVGVVVVKSNIDAALMWTERRRATSSERALF
jgi:hypothetical protein